MQWAPSLLLLLSTVAVEPLRCHKGTRWATTLNGLQNASWSPIRGEVVHSCQGNWTACARWLTNFGHEWEDHYDGCNNEGKAKRFETTQMVQKYCADRSDTSCTSTQFFTWHSLEHKPTHLCCCFDDLCNATFAKQLALATSTQKPPTGPKQNFTCEASMRNATTPDGLLNATAVDNHNETCEATWAPCVEFVYKNEADGLWRRWRAGCSYNYNGISYKDIVEQFCTATYECKQFDMIEPSTRDIGKHDHFIYTQAYACCCSGTGCNMPDTVSVAQGVAQTTPPPTPSSTGASTSTSQYSPPSTVGPASALTARPATTEPPDAGYSHVWLIIAIAAIVVGVIVIVAAVVIRRKTEDYKTVTEADVDDDSLLPSSLSPKAPWQPNKPAPKQAEAHKSSAKSAQMAESSKPTATSSPAAPSQPDQTTQHSLTAEATTQQQSDDSMACSPESLSTE